MSLRQLFALTLCRHRWKYVRWRYWRDIDGVLRDIEKQERDQEFWGRIGSECERSF